MSCGRMSTTSAESPSRRVGRALRGRAPAEKAPAGRARAGKARAEAGAGAGARALGGVKSSRKPRCTSAPCGARAASSASSGAQASPSECRTHDLPSPESNHSRTTKISGGGWVWSRGIATRRKSAREAKRRLSRRRRRQRRGISAGRAGTTVTLRRTSSQNLGAKTRLPIRFPPCLAGVSPHVLRLALVMQGGACRGEAETIPFPRRGRGGRALERDGEPGEGEEEIIQAEEQAARPAEEKPAELPQEPRRGVAAAVGG